MGISWTIAATIGITMSNPNIIPPIIIMVLLSIPATHCPEEDFVYTLAWASFTLFPHFMQNLSVLFRVLPQCLHNIVHNLTLSPYFTIFTLSCKSLNNSAWSVCIGITIFGLISLIIFANSNPFAWPEEWTCAAGNNLKCLSQLSILSWSRNISSLNGSQTDLMNMLPSEGFKSTKCFNSNESKRIRYSFSFFRMSSAITAFLWSMNSL